MKRFFYIIVFFLIGKFLFSQSGKDSLNSDYFPDSLNYKAADTNTIAKSDIKAEINYSAKDSLVYDLKNKKVFLYNDAKLSYENLKLDAGRIAVNQETLILEAYGIPDSANTGKFIQTPLMFQGDEKYEGAKLTYNFKTQQGSVSMGFSEAEVGYYFGDKIKKVSSDVLFIKNGMYTTSTDRDNPEYYFLSPKMKVIPNNVVIAQSVFLYIEGVPVFWIPFGVFPNKTGRASGLIVPTFGDDITYGNYISRLGYFWAINDYIDFALSGSYFTKGRIDAYGRFRYAKKYNYSGDIDGGYSRIRLGESTDIGTQNSDEWGFNVNHNQQLTPTSRLDAGLQFASGKQFYNISTNSLQVLLKQNIISNLTYSKTWESMPFSFDANYYRNQNLYTGSVTERIPLINFSVTQTFPFENSRSGFYDKKFYEYFSFSYNGSFLNNMEKIVNFPNTDSAKNIYDTRSGLRNNVNFAFSPKFEFITLAPYFNYTEIWYNNYLEKNYNPVINSAYVKDINAIKALRYFNTGLSFSTRFVGIFNPDIFNITGIRHTLTPALTYIYQPDFSKPGWGYYKTYNDTSGNQIRYSIFENGIFGIGPSGELQSVAFTLGNVFEMKTFVNDTTENKFNLFNLDAGINYNFAADSLKFSDLLLSYRTNIGEYLNISGGATFNLYKFDIPSHVRINQFLIDTEGKLADMTSFSISMSTSFNFGISNKDEPELTPEDTMTFRGSYKGVRTTKLDEVSFNIPFTGGLGFNYSEFKPNPLQYSHSSNLYGNIGFNLTEKWRFTFSTSYDIINRTFAAPYITAYRDLNSWEMSFNWYPSGTYAGFSLEVRIKAPQLRDIKVSKQTNSRGVFN